MKSILTLIAALLFSNQSQSPLACNLRALTPQERKEHQVLTRRLFGAVVGRTSTADGYAFRLDPTKISLAETAAWVEHESRCCPFFDFHVEVGREGGPLTLRLGGREGVREFIASEVGFAPAHDEVKSVASVLDDWVTRVETLVIPAAEALPEEKYSFAPTAGAFDGVRTFGGQIKHIAAANHQLAARALGVRPPAGTEGERAPESVKSKAEIMEYLRASFVALHRAARTANDDTERVDRVVDALVHASNHYGQIVEYLRMNRVIPPASR